jgi:hypothetical protein
LRVANPNLETMRRGVRHRAFSPIPINSQGLQGRLTVGKTTRMLGNRLTIRHDMDLRHHNSDGHHFATPSGRHAITVSFPSHQTKRTITVQRLRSDFFARVFAIYCSNTASSSCCRVTKSIIEDSTQDSDYRSLPPVSV